MATYYAYESGLPNELDLIGGKKTFGSWENGTVFYLSDTGVLHDGVYGVFGSSLRHDESGWSITTDQSDRKYKYAFTTGQSEETGFESFGGAKRTKRTRKSRKNRRNKRKSRGRRH